MAGQIVVLDHSVEPWHYAFYRLIETALGVVVAWLISYVPKLIRIEESGKRTRKNADTHQRVAGPYVPISVNLFLLNLT